MEDPSGPGKLFGRFSQNIPQPTDGGVDAVVEFDHRIVWPQPVADLGSHDDLAGAAAHSDQGVGASRTLMPTAGSGAKAPSCPALRPPAFGWATRCLRNSFVASR
jgi:hypothetical protein